MVDEHYRQTGSWTGYDAVRHWMYRDTFETLSAVEWPREVLSLEIGTSQWNSPLGRMLSELALRDEFALELNVGNYPSVDILDLQFQADSFDVVIADQVLEHVTKPWVGVAEMQRVCKKGGLIFVASPFMFPMHYCPLDCWRISRNGYEVLFPQDRFETLTLKTWGNMRIVAWANADPAARGFYGDYVSVERAKAEMPDYDQPHYNEDHPVVVWGIWRKK